MDKKLFYMWKGAENIGLILFPLKMRILEISAYFVSR